MSRRGQDYLFKLRLTKNVSHCAGVEQHGVAVGVGARDIFAAEIVARAGLVLDEHLLMPQHDSLSASVRATM